MTELDTYSRAILSERQKKDKLVAAVHRVGLENIWCRTHDRPLAVITDPLTVAARRIQTPLRQHKADDYYCDIWLELPQADGCYLIRKPTELAASTGD